MKKSTVLAQIGIFIGILLVANLISNKLFLRLDFTADKRYTLSKASKDVLGNISEVITVTAYFSEDLPPQLLSTKQDFEDMLVEYENRSGGNIVYEFVNPNESEETERNAQQNGISPLIVKIQERDQEQQLRAYMGAILQMGDKKEIIPIIQPGSGMEYALTTSIKKLVVMEKPKIGLLQGHGEPGINAMMQMRNEVSVLYDIEDVDLSKGEVPSYIKTLVIIAPKDTIPNEQLRMLDTYLSNGGNVFVAFNRVEGDLSNAMLSLNPEIGISSWLQDKGIEVGREFLVDANCGSVSVRQQMGPFPITTQVKFPYFPIIGKFGENPAVKGIEQLILPFASAISFAKKDSSMVFTVLATTSDKTGSVPAPNYVDINKRWTENDFRNGPQPVAVSVEGNIVGQKPSKLVVVSNGSFIVNGEGQQQQEWPADNVNFAVNLIDWLSDDSGLIDLRTKGVTSRPLEQLEDSTKAMIKYGNVFAPILLILVYAFIRRQAYNRKRQNWIEGNY